MNGNLWSTRPVHSAAIAADAGRAKLCGIVYLHHDWDQGHLSMAGQSIRSAVHLAIGVAIAAVVLHTWLVIGLVVPVTVSGSSMAPTLLGPHRQFRCRQCHREFAVGQDQLPPTGVAVCPKCGKQSAMATASNDWRGERLVIDRTAFLWRRPRRWELVVFRCPEKGGELCVKRAAGLPGENVTLADGDLLVNGAVVRKSLREQRALRQLVSDVGAGHDAIAIKPQVPLALECSPPDGGPVFDTLSYNQGAQPPRNRVSDIMLTFDAQLAGEGQMVLAAANGRGDWVLTLDFGTGRLRLAGNQFVEQPLPDGVADGQLAEWTFSLFDRQVLLAIDEVVVLAVPRDALETRRVSEGNPPDGPTLLANASGFQPPPFTIRASGLSGEIQNLAVWRDVYYAVRHADGRQPGTTRGVATTWRLGPNEYFVLGDNAAISDDSRSRLPRPGIDAKLLIGKPLGFR